MVVQGGSVDGFSGSPLAPLHENAGVACTTSKPKGDNPASRRPGQPPYLREISQDSNISAGSSVVLKSYGLESPQVPKKSPIHLDTTDLDIAEALLVDGASTETHKPPFLRRLVSFMGPGWLMSIAYVDPGNLEADLQTGAQFGYKLLWALLYATILGLMMQLVAARLGCATGRHLAEHCRDHFNSNVRVVLWGLTELAIIGSDIQEVIGCSIGLQILFELPLSVGVLITATLAFAFLFLERLGVRQLELFFGVLILILALSMGGLFSVISPDKTKILDGLALPRIPKSAVQQIVGMVGCVVMPHNLFLHSALVQSRVVVHGEEREAVVLFGIESVIAIFTTFLINMSVVAVFAKGFYGMADADTVGLRNAGFYLGRAYGDQMRVIWALGLCAAGQSSTMTGAYAGQWVMQGYLNLKVEPWKRAILTRGMALVPTLAVAIYFGGETSGSSGMDGLNEYLNVLQSLVLPFALVPLLTFAGSKAIMGDLVLSRPESIAYWIATCSVIAVNVYLLQEKLADHLPAGVLLAGAVFYAGSVIYVARSPNINS